MTAEQPAGPELQPLIGKLRLAIGLMQGIAAWLLLELVQPSRYYDGLRPPPETWWSVRHPGAFAALALITAFIPVVALAELGRMRARRLAVYLVGAIAVLGLLTAYDIARDPFDSGELVPRIWPSASLIFCSGIALFIVNQLLEFRETGQRFYTHYALHFEESWMRAFQFVLSLVFTLLVWGVLQLGAALFDLIHISAFGELLEDNWFRCPVLAMAFAASVHITDVRPALLRGMRNLGLTLLGWLLPLVTVLGAAFLAALLVQGVTPLWETRRAATILLTAVSVMLVLLNAAYKDGDPEHAPPTVLRWAGRTAGPVMLVLALLAAWAILLRVGQYGWTPQRVLSSATAAMAVFYSAGYTWASADRTTWLRRLERVNVTASIAALAILAGLFSPLADPVRISVASQIARLHSGATAPDKFDYQFLRFDTGPTGTAALAALTKHPNPEIAARAKRAQKSESRSYGREDSVNAAITEAPFAHAAVYPKGAALPPDFRAADWKGKGIYGAQCLINGTACDVFVLPGGGSAAQLIVVHNSKLLNDNPPEPQDNAAVFVRNEQGAWEHASTLAGLRCPGVLSALRSGKVQRVRPRYDDLQAGGIRLENRPDSMGGADPCPDPPANPAPSPTPGDASAPARMGPAFGNPGPG